MIIREATIDDAAAIARVHVDSWRTTYAGIVPEEYLAGILYDDREQNWRERLLDPTGSEVTFVAQNDDCGVIGFATGGPERTGNRTYRSEIYAIYLLAQFQRQGIGRRLALALAKWLLQLGHESLVIWVLAANPSRAFYEALGGEAVDEGLIEIGGAKLVEVAYGWKDLRRLVTEVG